MEAIANSFVMLFIVVDPIGVAPIFAALTRGADLTLQRKIALKGTGLAGLILLGFFFIGDELLKRLAIGIPAFRIAGGALLFLLAIDMVFARQSGLRSTTVSEQAEAEQKNDVSVFPLAFPLIAGPGALTIVLLMASSAPDLYVSAAMILVVLVVLGLTLLSLLFAPYLVRTLGETGVNVITRLFGVILAALAAQFIVDGIKASFFG